MYRLELQTAVKEVKPLRAVHIHCSAQHALREGLCGPEVGGRHGEVGEGDLDVQRHGDHVRDEDEGETAGHSGDGAIYNAIPKPGPEEDLANDFEPAVPASRTSARAETENKIFPGKAVKVEATEEEDDVV